MAPVWKNLNPCALLVEFKMGWHFENSPAAPQKLNMESPCNSVVSLPRIYPRELKAEA
jgi:hypothetical protein